LAVTVRASVARAVTGQRERDERRVEHIDMGDAPGHRLPAERRFSAAGDEHV
jgi:hypothetical protein